MRRKVIGRRAGQPTLVRRLRSTSARWAPDGCATVLFVGRFVEKKGLPARSPHSAGRALRAQARLTIVGGGGGEDAARALTIRSGSATASSSPATARRRHPAAAAAAVLITRRSPPPTAVPRRRADDPAGSAGHRHADRDDAARRHPTSCPTAQASGCAASTTWTRSTGPAAARGRASRRAQPT